MNEHLKIGFIGVGRISTAIVEGLCTSSITNTHIYLSPRGEANSKSLANKYEQVQRLENNQQVIDNSDIVIFAITPAIAMEVLRTLSFRNDQVLVSLVPVLNEENLLKAITPATQVVRATPTPTVLQHTGPILLFHSNEKVTQLFRHLGEPVHVKDEKELQVLWTLTGLITPFYDWLEELSSWTIAHGVDSATANQYIAGMFQALSFSAQQTHPSIFKQLAKHAETPNGMNEQAGRDIRKQGSHAAYSIALDRLLERFR